MNIGYLHFKDPFVSLAPLAGYGDTAFRRLCRDYGASLTTTEMVSAKGLCYGGKTESLLATAPNETPSCVQLFGSKPEFFTRALSLPQLRKFDIIDINMGCPVPKVTKCGEGGALMKDVKLAAAIVRACVASSGGRPVTVKFRLGMGEHTDYVSFARAMADSGAAALTVHGRTVEQGYSGTADWDAIQKVAAAVAVPVIGNGDIRGASGVAAAIKGGCGGVAIGRGALGSPWIFSGSPAPLKQVVFTHLDYATLYLPERTAVSTMRKHLCKYLGGANAHRELKQEINRATLVSQIKNLLSHADI